MSFTVDNVRNPYSAIPRTGITIYTLDDSYAYIDYSSALTFTVTTPANLTNASISRSDEVTAINESSIIKAYYEVGYMPIDATCRLRIDFPSDMPLTNSSVTLVGSGMFINTTTF